MDVTEYWDIYTEAFPEDERRTYLQHNKIKENDKFYENIIKDEYENNIGFITYWKLNKFIYIEHFAIDKNYRGKGYGTKYLKKFINNLNQDKIILEVEPPLDHKTKKRVEFYKKLDFIFNKYEYFQPPYKLNGNKVKLFLMSYKKYISEEEFEIIKEQIYTQVYGVKS